MCVRCDKDILQPQFSSPVLINPPPNPTKKIIWDGVHQTKQSGASIYVRRAGKDLKEYLALSFGSSSQQGVRTNSGQYHYQHFRREDLRELAQLCNALADAME